MRTIRHFSALSAAERAAALVDDRTLRAMPRFDDRLPVWLGCGDIAGRTVLLALTDGHRRGGTIGVAEASALSHLAAAVGRVRPEAVVVCWDTGGVRVQEGPAALASASAVGVGLTKLSLASVPVLTVITGPRGCFGAPSVIAAASDRVLLTRDASWALTGPKLLEAGKRHATETEGRRGTSARQRLRSGEACAVADTPAAIRAALAGILADPPARLPLEKVLDRCASRVRKLVLRLRASRPGTRAAAAPGAHDRDLLRFSFRGQWRPKQPILRQGQVHAAWGELDRGPALGIIVGADRARGGIGIEGAEAVTRMVRFTAQASRRRPAPIVTFLFCRGHANDLYEERAGLPIALAQCLRSLTAARLLGHPMVCVLGGGVYGAAYLSFAAPSHRILAIRGTTVAPMAPRVLAAFQRLRGMRRSQDTPQDLAALIPEIRIVESVVRLPGILREELDAAQKLAAREARETRKMLARGPRK